MKNVLFVCGKNKLRSPTAEIIFSHHKELTVDSAGVNSDSEVVLSSEQLQWADLIFVMEKSHKQKITSKFHKFIKNKRIICLDIPDKYQFMQPELVEILERKIGQYIN